MSTPINGRNDEPAHTERLPHDGVDDGGVVNDRRVTDDRIVDDRSVVDDRRVVDHRRVVDGDTRHDVVEREKEAFGGIKFGSAFFGWLTATGMAALLTALIAGTGAALGLGTRENQTETVGIVGAILLLVVLFVAYYCGGYVAGRMARFSGAKQGFAVWLWAIVIAVVVAIVGALLGAQFNVLANLNTFPRIPIGEGDLTTVGIITAVIVAAAALLGAVLGGIAGMRFHRRVDRAGFGD